MKIRLLTCSVLAAIAFSGCEQTPKQQAQFSCQYPVTYSLDSIQNLAIEDIIKDGKIGAKVKGEALPFNTSDSEGFIKLTMKMNLHPMSEALGQAFGGNIFYALDSAGAINSAFLLSADNKTLYVYPDEIAAQSTNDATPEETSLYMQGIVDVPVHAASMAMQLANHDETTPQLELLHPNSIYMLGEVDVEMPKQRFDLSGFAIYKGRTICIADKSWTTDIYYFDTTSTGEFNVSFCCKGPDYKTEDCDIEAVDVYNNQIVVSEETNNLMYMQNKKGEFELMPSDFTKVEADLSHWGAANAGVEGFCVDSKNSIVYFAKEREPRRLFSYDMKRNEFHTEFDDVVKGNDGDISDMKYLNGFVYYLDRANCLVVRIDVKTKEKVQYSFRKYSNNGKEHIYSADYGMAEALLITDNAIFVGMDNNNDPVSKYGEEIGLKAGSTAPSIFVFKRPAGF
ncbi:MAG: SdiA-regulated domain-containing protein [Bacteroidales bacterium]|nr:SdiA-regulated domain-containing protein [Bacteroidales bacterium]